MSVHLEKNQVWGYGELERILFHVEEDEVFYIDKDGADTCSRESFEEWVGAVDASVIRVESALVLSTLVKRAHQDRIDEVRSLAANFGYVLVKVNGSCESCSSYSHGRCSEGKLPTLCVHHEEV